MRGGWWGAPVAPGAPHCPCFDKIQPVGDYTPPRPALSPETRALNHLIAAAVWCGNTNASLHTISADAKQRGEHNNHTIHSHNLHACVPDNSLHVQLHPNKEEFVPKWSLTAVLLPFSFRKIHSSPFIWFPLFFFLFSLSLSPSAQHLGLSFPALSLYYAAAAAAVPPPPSARSGKDEQINRLSRPGKPGLYEAEVSVHTANIAGASVRQIQPKRQNSR